MWASEDRRDFERQTRAGGLLGLLAYIHYIRTVLQLEPPAGVGHHARMESVVPRPVNHRVQFDECVRRTCEGQDGKIKNRQKNMISEKMMNTMIAR